MDFGMIAYEGLSEADFRLPEQPQPFLPGTKNRNPQFYLGLSKWTYKEELKKKTSPQPQPGTLAFYAGYFNAVEFNAAHYEIPTAEKIQKWCKSIESVPFKCCPKFYKGITHFGKLDLTKKGLTMDFINRINLFGDKLGTSFIQLNEAYTADNKEKLIEYLKVLPAGFDVSLEIRGADWYSDAGKFTALVAQLNQLNKGLVITDSPGRRDVVHMQLSNATAFIRFNCQGTEELDLFRIEQWKKQLRSWYLQGLEKCYFFLHIHDKNAEDDFIQYARGELKFI